MASGRQGSSSQKLIRKPWRLRSRMKSCRNCTEFKRSLLVVVLQQKETKMGIGWTQTSSTTSARKKDILLKIVPRMALKRMLGRISLRNPIPTKWSPRKERLMWRLSTMLNVLGANNAIDGHQGIRGTLPLSTRPEWARGWLWWGKS